MSSAEANWPWFHRNLGRMETERLLVDSRSKDGSFLIRPSESMKGAYVLSLIHQQRIHHYRILPNDDGTLSVQAQEGVQQKRFHSLDELVNFYSQPKRGIVCGLTTPIAPPHPTYEELQLENDDDDDDDDDDADYDEPVAEDEKTDMDKVHTTITKYLLAALANADLTQVDFEFQDRLKSYLTNEVATDIQSMSSSTPELTHLKNLISKEVEKTHKQLDKLVTQIDSIQSLLDRVAGAKQPVKSTKRRSSSQDSSFETLSYKLNECASAVQTLETTAFSTFKDLEVTLIGKGKGSLSQPVSFQGVSDEVSFDVKLEQQIGTKKNMIFLVRLKESKLLVYKQGDPVAAAQVYQPNDVSQLIKSRSKEQKLGILFMGRTRKDYIFTNMQAREHFCQLFQMIRSKQMAYKDTDSISVFVGTWNMGDSAPPADINSWFKCEGWGRTDDKDIVAHDIYAIGTQESAMNEREWIAKIKSVLKSLLDTEYERVTSATLWGIRLLILVKQEYYQKISHIEHSQVRTGIGNTLGNKGGVGISFYFNNISLGFISAHLTSGTEKCTRRNQNYRDILKGMATLKHKHLSQFDLTHQFNHLFFFGDLNYRVNLDPEEIISHAKNSNVSAIYFGDQLRGEMEKKRVFVGFEEAPILFPPTYRFRKGERSMGSYIYVKKKRSGDRINEPSFCDRVLWKSYPGSRILNTSYGCTFNITTSDHSPVYSTFQIGGFKEFATVKAPGSTNTFIILQSCSAKILTSSKTHFCIEIHSNCFEGVFRTEANKDFIEASDGTLRPKWEGKEPIAKIPPVFTEQDYLEQQYILLMLKSTDSDEPYAECCVALGSVIDSTPQPVSRELIHQGLSVGEFECMIHVTMDHYNKSSYSEKDLYGNLDFIRQEVEEASSLDKGTRSTFYLGTSNTMSPMSRDTEPRPPVPIPRSGSTSTPPRPPPYSSAMLSTSVPAESSDHIFRPPMPLPVGSETLPPVPRRRDNAPFTKSCSVTTPTSTGKTLPPHPPSHTETGSSIFYTNPPLVPTRRQNSIPLNNRPPPVSDKPRSTLLTSSGSPPSHRKRINPPVPSKRTKVSGESPPLVNKSSQHSITPSNSVPEFLRRHNLHKYSSLLLENGFDNVKFLNEITDEDLEEIGISDDRERQKLLNIFRSNT